MSDPPTPPHVPYQAYKSKRHSRGLSNSNPHLNAPPVPRPASTAQSPPKPSPISHSEKDIIPSYIFPRDRPQQTSTSPKIVLAPSSPIAPLVNGLPSPPASNHSNESSDSPLDISRRMEGPKATSPAGSGSIDTVVPESQAPNVPSLLAFRPPSLSAIASTPSSPIASGSAPTSPASGSTSPIPRKASKFRHVSHRKPQLIAPSSHLGLAGEGLRSLASSDESSPLHQNHTTLPVVSPLSQSEPHLTSQPTVKSSSLFVSPSISERTLPPLPPSVVQKSAVLVSAPPSPSSSPRASRTTSLSSGTPTRPGALSVIRGHTPNTSRSLTPNRLPVPYRPGFQPKGVYRHLTDDFLALRKIKRDGADKDGSIKRVERNKLERRLEKLIDLHFPIRPPPNPSPSTNLSAKWRPGSSNVAHEMRRTSSIFDPGTYKNLNLREAGDLWKSVLVGNLGESDKLDKRAMEQRITPWEADSAVSKCPLCSASFHPLTNRKHHCRLCGRIICSLPPKNPQRPVTCSILFIVDSKTRKIEEVGEGVDYGVRKRRSASIGKTDDTDNDEKFLKGVRLCRECRPILLREHYKQERLHIPPFVRLHEAFVALEQEIQDALPQFQESILALNHNNHPTREALGARKRLLEAFSQYDALAKRIKQLPYPNGTGTSQGRIQAAILMRANLFLQNNMFPLQSLPNPSRTKDKDPAGSLTPDTGDLIGEPGIDPDSELAQALQPLLEQEALLETFVEEAMAQRKFEDVKTLKANLHEIRSEIEKMLDGVDVNTKNRKGKSK